MNTTLAIPGLNPDELGLDLIGRLALIHPEGIRKDSGWFYVRLPNEDPRCIAILDELRSAGLVPWVDHTRERVKGAEYCLTYIREYDDSDLASCAYLQLRPKQFLQGVPPNTVEESFARDHEHVALEDIDPSFDFMSVSGCHVIVPRRVRMLLDSANLTGIHWRPVTLWEKREGRNRKLDPDAFSDLSGEGVLPPMAPSVDLRDASNSKAVSPGYDKPVFLREGLYTPAEPRYRAADLEAFGPFDVAPTFERLWGGERNRYIVVSQRFYRFCRDNRLKTDFVPVRIEP